MGNKQQVQRIDANKASVEHGQNSMLGVLQQAFQQSAHNGVLDQAGFNEALLLLERVRFQRLRDTPLGLRLFFQLDLNSNRSLDQQEFIKGLSQLLSNREMRIVYSFKAFDKDHDNVIKRAEFVHFLEESWKCAFRTLANEVHEQQPQGHVVREITDWGNMQVPQLRSQAEKLFAQIDNQTKGFLDFMAFKNWVTSLPSHVITAQYQHWQVSVPLTLYSIDQQA